MGTGATVGRRRIHTVDVLLTAHLPRAARLAYLLTGDGDDVERIASKSFVRAYGGFGNTGDPWGFDIALRREVSALARRSALRRRARDLWGRRAPAPLRGLRRAPGERLWDALQALPVSRRTAIVLRLGEGLSEAQAAEVMGCPAATVRTLAERGMRGLAGGTARPELETGLRRVLEDRARSVSLSPTHSLSSRARLRRIEIALLWVGILAAGVYAFASAASVSPPRSFGGGDRIFRTYQQNGGYSLLRIDGRQPPAQERLAIAQGRIGPDEWALSAYKDARGFLCMDVSLNVSYRTLDCTAPALSGFHAFATSSMPRDTTFVYGDVASSVESLDFRMQPAGSHTLHMFEAPTHLRLQPGTSMYIAVIPRYMVRLESRAEARALDYRPLDGVLVARDELGRVVQRTLVFMGTPKP